MSTDDQELIVMAKDFVDYYNQADGNESYYSYNTAMKIRNLAVMMHGEDCITATKKHVLASIINIFEGILLEL
jgi:uncharacterized Ntn-hydrolase superfamily protein